MSDYDFTKFLAVKWANEAINIGSSLINEVTPERMSRRVLEEHFFLTSITMANRMCRYISQNTDNEIERTASLRFVESSNAAKDVRNKREHFDDYIDGDHPRQKEFTRRRGSVSADLTSTIVDRDGYHLGNKATVQVLISECNSLLEVIKPPY